MFSSEVRSLIVQVITSWQVIAATVGIILFILLVNSAAKPRRRKPPPLPKNMKAKKEATAAPAPEAKSDNAELGLEE